MSVYETALKLWVNFRLSTASSYLPFDIFYHFFKLKQDIFSQKHNCSQMRLFRQKIY